MDIKVKLFRAAVVIFLLKASETWTVTNKIGKSLDGLLHSFAEKSPWCQLERPYN